MQGSALSWRLGLDPDPFIHSSVHSFMFEHIRASVTVPGTAVHPS